MGEVMDFRMRLARDKARYFEVIVSYIDETLRPGTKKFNVSKSAGAEGTIEIAEAN